MYTTVLLGNKPYLGKLQASTSIVADVNEVLESQLPHVYDLRSGQNFLIDTRAEVLFLNQRYKISVMHLLIVNFPLLMVTALLLMATNH